MDKWIKFFLILWINYRPYRERNVDIFLPVSFGQFLDELVLYDILVPKEGGMENHIEVDAGVGEGVETHRWSHVIGVDAILVQRGFIAVNLFHDI